MILQKNADSSSTVKAVTYCEICKAVHDREREATSRCLECQKFFCRQCVQAHQSINITRDHSIYELEIEKDILCKVKFNILKLLLHCLLFFLSIIKRNLFVIIANNVKYAFALLVHMSIIVIMS